jgi:hypothetical protein
MRNLRVVAGIYLLLLVSVDVGAALAVVTLPNAQPLQCTYLGAPAFCTGAPIPPAAPARVGQSYTIIVGVLADNGFNIDGGYRGTVTFTSSDSGAVLPSPYTFTAADAGVHSFTIAFATVGNQLVTATDPSVPTNFGLSVPVFGVQIAVPAVQPAAVALLSLMVVAVGLWRMVVRPSAR